MKVVDRKKAAEILKVSVRTVDRYLRKGELKSKIIGGRVFIDVKSLPTNTNEDDFKTQELENLETPKAQTKTKTKSSDSDDQGTYKNLYLKAQEELKNKQERLEGANYRVGQLEGMLKESIPLLDYKKAITAEQEKREELEEMLDDIEKDTDELKQKLESKSKEISHINKRLWEERINKRVFLIILILLFMLQPLWLLFPFD